MVFTLPKSAKKIPKIVYFFDILLEYKRTICSFEI